MFRMEEAAEKIQAAYKGFYVRRCRALQKLRLIADIKGKLKKLNMRASDPDYVDKLCSDPMENVRMKEEIMALLLELDAIQGVLPSVRKIRKSVTRDVVEFQEIIDAFKVDHLERNVSEEIILRAGGQTNHYGTEPVNLLTPPLRRVMSLDDNVYSEQQRRMQQGGRKLSDKVCADGSARCSGDDAQKSRPLDGWGKSSPVYRSLSGNHRIQVNTNPLTRNSSEVLKNPALCNPNLGRSASEVVRRRKCSSGQYGQSISGIQRKRFDAVNLSSTVKPTEQKTRRSASLSVENTDTHLSRSKVMNLDREQAAACIQRVFRGHLSRRSKPLLHLRIIAEVKTRLRDLLSQLQDTGCVKRLRSEDMECLKWSEEITALLLKLDSVQGVAPSVRDIRKSVTREVIKLQEKVDSITHDKDGLSRIFDVEGCPSASLTTSELARMGDLDEEIIKVNGGKKATVQLAHPDQIEELNHSRLQLRIPLVCDNRIVEMRVAGNLDQSLDVDTRMRALDEVTDSNGELRYVSERGGMNMRSLRTQERFRSPDGWKKDTVSREKKSCHSDRHEHILKNEDTCCLRAREDNDEDKTLRESSPPVDGPFTPAHSSYLPCIARQAQYLLSGKQCDVSLADFWSYGDNETEARACDFLRSGFRVDNQAECEYAKASSGAGGQNVEASSISEVPVVQRISGRPLEHHLAVLISENARLKSLLCEVLEHAENQYLELKAVKCRLAVFEKQRLKKEDLAPSEGNLRTVDPNVQVNYLIL